MSENLDLYEHVDSKPVSCLGEIDITKLMLESFTFMEDCKYRFQAKYIKITVDFNHLRFEAYKLKEIKYGK